MARSGSVDPVDAHYSVEALEEVILEGLESSGKSLDAVTVEDLGPVDHFHIGGMEATLELLSLADLQRGADVLDVGGGLGGAARLLGTRIESRVTVLDATSEYCRVGEQLTDLVGLSDRVAFHHGDACNMPFSEQSFDIVWMQHANMNIPDKAALFREMFRVLRPNGRVALHEVMAGANQPGRFPVPWAGRQAISCLAPQEEMKALIAEAGLKEVLWNDVSETALHSWRQRLAAIAEQGPPTLGVHLLMGADALEKAQNVLRNLDEDRVTVVQAVLRRP
jgi:SAM-dependent methyltransferase